MALVSSPPLGYPVPDLPHAVSVQLPTWQDMIDFAHGEPRVRKIQQSGYPRSFLHKDIESIHNHLSKRFGNAGKACLLFPALQYASSCRDYLCNPLQGNTTLDDGLVRIKALEFDIEHAFLPEEIRRSAIVLYAVYLPERSLNEAMVFWRLTGCGISSRMAEDALKHIEAVREVPLQGNELLAWPSTPNSDWAVQKIRERVAYLLERSPTAGTSSTPTTANDVYLFPTGMSAIYHLTLMLRDWPGNKSAVFGFPYELTLKVQQDFAKRCVFYGFGTVEELELLEDHLHMQSQLGQRIQAVWCEIASNPLLRTVDLERLRRLADRHGFLIVVDDTIGSAANVDVLSGGIADIVVTSLTKSFSGFADVMGGSIALNPRSSHYASLKQVVDSRYVNHLYGADALKLEANSRGVLPRVARMNSTASHLVQLLEPLTRDPKYPLAQVYYPSTCTWSADNFRARMRPATEEFTPGYGGLFTLDFNSVATASAFFDALDIHKGPSLGANVTLAQPYVQTVFKAEKEWAARYGLNETIIRISVGLEDQTILEKEFLRAMEIAASSNA